MAGSKPTNATVSCVVCRQKTVVPLASIVIDEYCGVFRTRCGNPACGAIVEQDLDPRLTRQLEDAGVQKVNDLVERARIQLANDDMLWRMIEGAQ